MPSEPSGHGCADTVESSSDRMMADRLRGHPPREHVESDGGWFALE